MSGRMVGSSLAKFFSEKAGRGGGPIRVGGWAGLQSPVAGVGGHFSPCRLGLALLVWAKTFGGQMALEFGMGRQKGSEAVPNICGSSTVRLSRKMDGELVAKSRKDSGEGSLDRASKLQAFEQES